ncbi:MAG: anti-sigma factor [Alphaproteobacteria bacterium]|jgi:anti-sigma factor RsiW|nr:anti-sigma factor [Alphaproteobacteria bacterium]
MSTTPPGGEKPPIDDDMLNAYVDGRLDSTMRAHVAAWLEENPDQAARLADWQAGDEALRAAYEPVTEEPVPARLAAFALPAAKAARPWWRQAAAAMLLLAVGAAGGYGIAQLNRAPLPVEGLNARHLADSAASAHRVFTVEVRHPVEVGADQEQHLVTWLGKRVGAKLIAPRLEEKGYKLVGGRLLSSDAGPAAQLMYENREGKRVTAYVASSVADGQTAFQFRQQGKVSTFYWVDNGTGYALSGDVERAALLDIAKIVYAQLQP